MHDFSLNLIQAKDGLWHLTVLCNKQRLTPEVAFEDKRDAELYFNAFVAGIEYMTGGKRP